MLDTGYWKNELLPDVAAFGYYGGVGSIFFHLLNQQNTLLIEYQASRNQYPDGSIFVQSLYIKGVNVTFQEWITSPF